MSNTFKLKIMAADKIFYDGDCTSLVVNVSNGEVGILANHTAEVLAVVPGVLKFSVDGENWTEVVNGSGFVEVADNQAKLLVDTAERPEDIDAIRAREALERAEEHMKLQQIQREYLHSKASLARAMARLKATSKYM